MSLTRNSSVASIMLSCVLGGALAGCVTSPADSPDDSPDEPLGSISIDLVGAAASGATYRLRAATITVTGPGYTRVWNTEENQGQSLLSDQAPAGAYSATVQDGWRLERVVGSDTLTVPATLSSDNPALFTVTAAQRTTVPLRFQVGSELVDMVAGYDIAISIDEPALPGELIVATGSASRPAIQIFSSDAAGDTLPVRRIAGASTGLLFPEHAIVVGNQLIVADSSFVIHFFAISANGSTAPIKQITGSLTKLNNPLELAVANDELYVLQRDGILVFRMSAIGNVAPVRTVATLPETTGKHFAIDKGEVYVTVQNNSAPEQDIRVYSATTAGQPTRTIRSASPAFCPSGIAIQAGEIFVASNNCGGTGIVVFPETASGTVIPTRTITGSNTGILNPLGLAVFHDEIYLLDGTSPPAMRVFSAIASGNAIARRTLTGTHTGMENASSLFLH